MRIKKKTKPYKGYLPTPKTLMLFFQKDKGFDFAGFGSLIALASLCDWDIRHEAYACLKLTDDEIGRLWKCSPSTVWRIRKRLEKKGLMHTSEIGYPRLTHFELFDYQITKELAKEEFANSQEVIARTQELVAVKQGKIAKVQDNQDQNVPQSSRFSSKENVGVFQNSSGVPGELSEEDKEWIDRNTSEKFDAEFLDEVWGGYEEWAKNKKF